MSDVLFTIEDREYTAEDAQNKIQNADQHIKTIEEENAALRQKVDEYMEALSKNQEDTPDSAKPNPEPETKGISEDEIAKIVKAQLEATQAATTYDANLNSVRDALRSRYGDEKSANQEFEAKAREMGLSVDEALELGKKSPKVVLSWFGEIQPQSSAPAPGRNTQGIEGSTRGPQEGTWEWWQKLRRDDPKVYFSPKMARKRMQDAERLGRDGFFSKN